MASNAASRLNTCRLAGRWRSAHFGLEDYLITVIAGECDVDRAVLGECGLSSTFDLIAFIASSSAEDDWIARLSNIKVGLQGVKVSFVAFCREGQPCRTAPTHQTPLVPLSRAILLYGVIVIGVPTPRPVVELTPRLRHPGISTHFVTEPLQFHLSHSCWHIMSIVTTITVRR